MSFEIDSVKIPDSRLAREVTAFVRDSECDFLFNHSARVYFWAALNGRRKSLCFDPELLYTAAMFHDIGLTARYHDSALRFEVDGANAARDFLQIHRISAIDVQKVWAAIALHTTPGIPEHMDPEIALIQSGAGMDVAGRGYEQFTEEQRRIVITHFPRGENFARDIINAFYDGLRHRPQSTFGTFNDDFLAYKDPNFQRVDICKTVLCSHWEVREQRQYQAHL